MADAVQCSGDGRTVWVHAPDGSTVGRFSTTFGMDLHTTVTAQLEGAGQCLACTHGPASSEDWAKFKELMLQHYAIEVPDQAIDHARLNAAAPRERQR